MIRFVLCETLPYYLFFNAYENDVKVDHRFVLSDNMLGVISVEEYCNKLCIYQYHSRWNKPSQALFSELKRICDVNPIAGRCRSAEFTLFVLDYSDATVTRIINAIEAIQI